MTSYIKFPDELIAVPGYPGYVWNIDEQKLYSYKSGLLHELYFYKPSHWNRYSAGYRVCKNGRYRKLPLTMLQTLKPKFTTLEYDK